MSEDNDFRKFGSLQCKYFDCGLCKTNGKKCGKATNEIDNCIRLYKAEYNLIKHKNVELKKYIDELKPRCWGKVTKEYPCKLHAPCPFFVGCMQKCEELQNKNE